MAKDYPRQQRVGDQIQRELAELIRTQIKDPRLSPIWTIAEVRVSSDFGQARVYITVLDDKGPQSVEVLNAASRYLRVQLGARMHLKKIPHLKFVFDTVSESGARLSSLIDRAVADDQNKHPPDE